MPGKPNPPPLNLTAAVWTLSRSVPTGGREVGETVNCLWHESGEYYEAEIIEKYDDGTYDVYFAAVDMVVEKVHSDEFEAFRGTSSSDYLRVYYRSLPPSQTSSLTHLNAHPSIGITRSLALPITRSAYRVGL